MQLTAKSRFTAIMALTATLAMLLVGLVTWVEGQNSLREAEFTHLTSIRVAKADQIEDYFETMQMQLAQLAANRTTVEAMVELRRGYRALSTARLEDEQLDLLSRYYGEDFLPKLAENLIMTAPEVEQVKVSSRAGRYLQYHYTARPKLEPTGASTATTPYGLRDARDGSDYSAFHAEHHESFRRFLSDFGYYDIFLIDFETGEIIYSVAKEVDFATSLTSGPYRSSGLADVLTRVQRQPVRGRIDTVDFAPYAPSFNAPAAFMATPIFNGPNVVGILAFQAPVDRIENIMTSDRLWREEGLGESGETYIVGSDLRMRSNSRFLIEQREAYFDMIRRRGIDQDIIDLMDRLNTTILLQPVRTEGARAAVSGEAGYFVAEDYRGVRVLSTYSKLDIDGLDWGIVSEIDEDEAFAPVGRLLRRILIAMAIFVPIVAYLSYILAQGFMSPVQKMVATARAIRSDHGNSDEAPNGALRFEAAGAREYRDLSAELNAVMDRAREDIETGRAERAAFRELLIAALPPSVAERVGAGQKQVRDNAKLASIMLVKIDNFGEILNMEDLSRALELQQTLDTRANQAARALGIDTFHQMGMEFIAVCGLTMPYINHFERMVALAKTLTGFIDEHNRATGDVFKLSMGLDVGPLAGGLGGGDQLEYNILGPGVYRCNEAGYLSETNHLTLTDAAKAFADKIGFTGLKWGKLEVEMDINGETEALWSVQTDALRSLPKDLLST